MKRLPLWAALLLLLLCIPACVNAQDDDTIGTRVPNPCHSTWHNYSNVKLDYNLVRSDLNHRVIHTQYKALQTSITGHTFLIKNYSTNLETTITTQFNATVSDPYNVDISDMELFEGECYFCGTLTCSYVDMNGDSIRKGIVGHFSPQSMLLGSGTIQFCTVPQTRYLYRLAVTPPPSVMALVNVIGENTDGQACLVELSPGALPQWKVTMNHLPNLPEIVFSDILTGQDSLVLLSQMDCANNHGYNFGDYDPNHQVFMLDKFSYSGCFHDYGGSPITHYMAHYSIDQAENCSFHVRKALMSLSNIGNRGFYVAFGVQENTENQWGVRLFNFDYIWQYDSSIYYRTGSYLSTVWEAGCLSDTVQPFILSDDLSHPRGLVTLPKLGSSSVPIEWIESSSSVFKSLTQRRNTSYIDIAGRTLGALTLDMFGQDINVLEYSSCLNKGVMDGQILPRKRASLLVANWKTVYEDKAFYWSVADFSYGNEKPDEVCKKCNINEEQ